MNRTQLNLYAALDKLRENPSVQLDKLENNPSVPTGHPQPVKRSYAFNGASHPDIACLREWWREPSSPTAGESGGSVQDWMDHIRIIRVGTTAVDSSSRSPRPSPFHEGMFIAFREYFPEFDAVHKDDPQTQTVACISWPRLKD